MFAVNNDIKYHFSWDLLGDLTKGRPNLGPLVRLEVYRLMMFTLRDTLEREVGTETSDRIFYNAGNLAGQEFFRHVIKDAPNLSVFVNAVKEALKTMNIGILRVEKADPEKGAFVFTVSEDVDCSGLPELGFGVCTYDEGFIAGLMEGFTGKKFRVKEVDCWCTGDRTCRFSVDLIE
jgi:hypothetical protein